jgi:hypothetical protein
MSGDAQDRADGIIISRGWLAIIGSLAAIVLALGSWGVSQSTARGQQEVQLSGLAHRVEGFEESRERIRSAFDELFRSLDQRLANVADRVSRLEVKMDARDGPPRGRTGLDCWPNGLRLGPTPAGLRYQAVGP